MTPSSLIVTKPNDVWLLGHHRLICGDSTHTDVLTKLMQEEKADLVFTDPPYNVDYIQQDRHMMNDNVTITYYRDFLRQAFLICKSHLKKYASLYTFHASRYAYACRKALITAGFTIRNELVWAKNHFVISGARYKSQYEPFFYCHQCNQRDRWYGDHAQTTVWEFPKPKANRLHPTMKPVPLIEKALINSSRENDIVLDMFSGSGSTLIACEQQQRRAYLIEIEPHYCDVIVERWQKTTGNQALLEGTNKNFNTIKQLLIHQQRNIVCTSKDKQPCLV